MSTAHGSAWSCGPAVTPVGNQSIHHAGLDVVVAVFVEPVVDGVVLGGSVVGAVRGCVGGALEVPGANGWDGATCAWVERGRWTGTVVPLVGGVAGADVAGICPVGWPSVREPVQSVLVAQGWPIVTMLRNADTNNHRAAIESARRLREAFDGCSTADKRRCKLWMLSAWMTVPLNSVALTSLRTRKQAPKLLYPITVDQRTAP